MNPIEFPQVVDASFLAAFRACHQRAFRTYMEHWKAKGESVHLVAGKAFAAGLEATRRAYYEKGESEQNAIQAGVFALMLSYGDFQPPEDSKKSLDRVAGALDYYFEQYPLATDSARPLEMPSGKSAIEFNFIEPLPYMHPVSGAPILYTGRSDMICSFAEGIYVEDDKTTSQLGASWSRQWDLRSQFTGYCWAAKRADIKVNGVLVRGVSILKTKYETLQAITYRSEWEIERWLKQVIRDLAAMEGCWREGYWDFALDNACTEYGGCAFMQTCKSNDPDSWLPMYFERKRWDPIERTETLLEPA